MSTMLIFSLFFCFLCVFFHCKGTDSIEGIFSDMSKIRNILEPLLNMVNLRLLKFCMLDETGVLNMNSKVYLSEGFEYLYGESRYLHGHGYPSTMLPMSFSLNKLITLSVPYGKIQQL